MVEPLSAVSPLDGRYAQSTVEVQSFFSESALFEKRTQVEVDWLKAIIVESSICQLDPETKHEVVKTLSGIVENFNIDSAKRIKQLEQETNHDVKAVEYFCKEKLEQALGCDKCEKVLELFHFACTSEDINATAYALMLNGFRSDILVDMMVDLQSKLGSLASLTSECPMLGRTHGQPATPTTLGKEIAVFAFRLNRQVELVRSVPIYGKMAGATGNYNAHIVASKTLDWPQFASSFVKKLGLSWNPLVTQIESHDSIAELSHCMSRVNTILIDLCRDIWGYISLNYFGLKKKESEVGSSTMPHKVNPIDFENAEGNLGLANALFSHFAEKLPISRFQRDLSDSTVLRSLGVAFGHSILAYKSLMKGLDKLVVNDAVLKSELDAHWEVYYGSGTQCHVVTVD
mmetsp:Transcript_19502/g.49953  ORF Transcript_19502/g.49953 Transcript_19502/m.49953 type:complete len:402 (+) Transcript_19502:28-1233(+)